MVNISNNSKTYFSPRNEFSEAHYDLPKQCGMFDIDLLQGQWLNLNMAASKKEAQYVEYRVLRHANTHLKFNADRIRFEAFFELKFTGTDRVKECLKLPEGKSEWAFFMLAKIVGARFFIVVGTNGEAPFYFFEYTPEGEAMKYKTLMYNSENRSEAINDFWQNELNLF